MQFFSNKRIIILLVSFILLVALIGFSLRDRDHASLPEQIVKDVVGFGQSIFSKPAQYIMGVFENINSLLNTYEENQRLKERLDEFAKIQAKAVDLESENDRLREMVDKKEDLRDYETISATVIARNPDQWEEKVIVDRGTIHGIEENMAVITAQGIIGKVILATPFTSTVELLSTNNPNYRVSAMIVGDPNEEVFGLIEGYDKERSELILKRIDSAYEVKVGQKVISSGLGGIFPKGLYIGEVTEVTTEDFGLTKMTYVKPAADFALLDHVMLVKRSLPTTEGTDSLTTFTESDEAED